MQQLKVGSSLQGGKYKIEKVLGQGGFGITYLATQELLDRKVCIKEFFFKEYCERDEATSHVSLGTQSNHELVERFMNKFLKEARTISQLDHRNIIKIHDIFKENNTAYYVMDYVEGESLNDMVNRRGALPEKEAVAYIERVADALKYIHQQNINHLDIKPGNIMIRQGDYRVILIDFGLSKQYDAQGGQTSTTPVGISHGYAPMEQYKQGGVSTFSPQTDIYALGATLYKLVTGNTPPQAMDILDEGLPELPKGLSLSVKNAISQAMQSRKKDRPKDVKEFLELIGTSITVQSNENTINELPKSHHLEETTVIIENNSSSNGFVESKSSKIINDNSLEKKYEYSEQSNIKSTFSKLKLIIYSFYLCVIAVVLFSIAYSGGFLVPVFVTLGLVDLYFINKQIGLRNDSKGKCQNAFLRYVYLCFNVIILAFSFYVSFNLINPQNYLFYPIGWVFLSGMWLISLGMILLLLWEKWGVFLLLVGSILFCLDITIPDYTVFGVLLSFVVLLFLFVKKKGKNSWNQMEKGSSLKYHKRLLVVFISIMLIMIGGSFCLSRLQAYTIAINKLAEYKIDVNEVNNLLNIISNDKDGKEKINKISQQLREKNIIEKIENIRLKDECFSRVLPDSYNNYKQLIGRIPHFSILNYARQEYDNKNYNNSMGLYLLSLACGEDYNIRKELEERCEKNGCMYVLDIIFSNTDGKNFKLNKDSDLHAADIKYLSQSILAIPLVDKDSIKFDASLKYPSGRIDKPGVWSIKYLRRQSAYINSWNNWSFELAREYALGGWGNEEGGTYSPGKHTYTLQYNGNKVFSKSVKLK